MSLENKSRRRHLDLAMNLESRERFKRRSEIIREIRAFFDAEGFLEVETPVLQPLYGGATARPFKTHHNALDDTLYLRIADELYLKRCIVARADGNPFFAEEIVRQYDMVIAGPSRFGERFLNSVIIGFGSTFLSIFLGTLAAYAFSRFRFKGRRLGLLSLLLVLFNPDIGAGEFFSVAFEADKFRLADWRWDYSSAVLWVVVLGGIGQTLIPYSSDQGVVQRYMSVSSERILSSIFG